MPQVALRLYAFSLSEVRSRQKHLLGASALHDARQSIELHFIVLFNVDLLRPALGFLQLTYFVFKWTSFAPLGASALHDAGQSIDLQ